MINCYTKSITIRVKSVIDWFFSWQGQRGRRGLKSMKLFLHNTKRVKISNSTEKNRIVHGHAWLNFFI